SPANRGRGPTSFLLSSPSFESVHRKLDRRKVGWRRHAGSRSHVGHAQYLVLSAAKLRKRPSSALLWVPITGFPLLRATPLIFTSAQYKQHRSSAPETQRLRSATTAYLGRYLFGYLFASPRLPKRRDHSPLLA